jgi:heme exporter protein D
MEMSAPMWYGWLAVTVAYIGLLVHYVLSFRKQLKELKVINEEAKKTLLDAKEIWNSMIADEVLFKEFIGWRIIYGHIPDEQIRVDH